MTSTSVTKVTKIIYIRNRVITIADIRKLANEVIDIYKKWKKQNKDKHVYFAIESNDQSKYESSNPAIFNEDFPLNSNRINAIEMRFAVSSDVEIEINLKHGSADYAPDNQITVRGTDRTWVEGIAKRLDEINKTFEPQNTFVNRYIYILYTVLSVSIGAFFVALLIWLFPESRISSYFDISTYTTFPANQPMLFFLLKYLVYALFGFIPTALILENIKHLWPSIEIQVGPEHILREKKNRKLILNLVLLGAIPMLIQLVYDILKTSVTNR